MNNQKLTVLFFIIKVFTDQSFTLHYEITLKAIISQSEWKTTTVVLIGSIFSLYINCCAFCDMIFIFFDWLWIIFRFMMLLLLPIIFYFLTWSRTPDKWSWNVRRIFREFGSFRRPSSCKVDGAKNRHFIGYKSRLNWK